MNPRTILPALIVLALLSGCSLPSSEPPTPVLFPPTSLVLPSPTLSLASPTSSAPFIPLPTQTQPVPGAATTIYVPMTVVVSSTPGRNATPTAGITPYPAAAFCADSQPTTLINNLKTALQTQDGPLLASLVSPVHGMEVRYYRDGRVVNYDQAHAKFLFETTYEVNWGDAPGSGLPTAGSFHDIVLPALMKVFGQNYTLSCNQLQVGGTTYTASWPYPQINYYSLYYPGTAAHGNMDWHTWVVGMEYITGKPYIYSMMQFEWEP